ncbi:MAG: hypothetical protein ACYC6L_11775 [Anaerolineae bacterium]
MARWLLGSGGPAIRCRTARELLDHPEVDINQLDADLLAAPVVRAWLARLGASRLIMNALHGSKPAAFENTASKLADLGLRAGREPLDIALAPYRAWLAGQVRLLEEAPGIPGLASTRAETEQVLANYVRWFTAMLVASRLAWLGYPDEPLRTLFRRRLDTLFVLADSGEHTIYIDQDTFRDYPNNSFRKRPFIDPRFYPFIPSIHDIYALAHYPPEIMDSEAHRKIRTVIEYILHPDYQALNEGYGIMRAGPRRYFSMGWSIHLPGYHGFNLEDGEAGRLVQRLELMAHFPAAVRHPWFAACLAHLESFRTEEGIYRFPGRYLREASAGYWVNGAYLRLEENRLAPLALELDSTFRMLYIKRLAGAVG